MKNMVLVAGFVALLALGGWFAFGGGGEVASSPGPALEQDAEVEVVTPEPGELAAPEIDAPLAAGAASSERTEVEVEDEAPATAALADAHDPAKRLRVRVVDATGVALPGIEVQLVDRRGTWDDVQKRATTEEDGVATFESVDLSMDGTMTFGGTAAAFVRVDVLAVERVDARLEESLLGLEEPVELRLPPTGSVVVRVLDVDHGPPLGNVTVKLSHVPEGEAHDVSPFGTNTRTWVQVKAVDGVARFPYVACGIDVNAAVTRDVNSVSCSAFGPGPLRVGEEARLETRFGTDTPLVQLRVLDANGAPYAEANLEARIESVGGFMSTEHELYPRTNPMGRVRIDVEVEPNEKVTRRLTLRGPTAEAGGERPIATIELPKDLPKGLTDLGDVTLGAAPLFVAGRVVDDTGRPLEGLKLRLERQDSKDQGWWERDHEFSARSGADGSFEVRGSRPGEQFRVTAKSADHASRWTQFERGAANVLVELTQPGSLAGTLLLDPHVDPTQLELRLEGSPDDELADGSSEMTNPSADGSFLFENLLTGSGRKLVIRTSRVWRELAEVEDLDVVAGQVLRDPRLDPLDLRGKLFVHELEVVGGQAEDRFSGQLQFGSAGDESLDYQGYMNGRELTLITTFERIDLKTKFRGYRSIEMNDVAGHIELVLLESLDVTVVLLGDGKLPEPPIFIKPALVPEGGGHADVDLSGDPFDERREVRTKAPAFGRLEVHWVLERRSPNGGLAMSFPLERMQYAEVLEEVENQRFEVTLSQEEIEEIVSRLF